MALQGEIDIPVDRTLTSVLLLRCKPDVESLTLRFTGLPADGSRELRSVDPKVTCKALLHGLKGFRHLRELVLKFGPPVALVESDVQDRASLPITRLELSCYSSGALSLIQLCPNLTELSLNQRHRPLFKLFPAQPRDVASERPWPDLQVLEVGHFRDITTALGKVRAARRLHIGIEMAYSNAEEDANTARLLQLVQKSSPIELSLLLRAAERTPSAFWTEITKAPANQLRVLMLGLYIPKMESSLLDCLEALPESLSSLTISVLCLKILWPTAAPHHLMAPGYVDEDREDQEKEDIMQARLMEPRRTELLQGLPHRLASALPSLQYLTIIDDAPSLLSLAWADYRVAFNQGLVMAGPTDSGSEQGGAANSAEIIDSEAGMESRRTYQHYGQRCWKVVDAENGKELVNIDYDKLLSAREQAVEARAAPL